MGLPQGLPQGLVRRLRSFRGAAFGKGATPREIDLAARRLSVVFPRSYGTFLELFGWASIGGLDLYGLGEDVPAHLNLVEVTLSERTEMRPRMPHHLMPLANDGGGNVFVGRVERRVGSTKAESYGPMGRTQFSVEILENVKGKLGGAVTVSQQGAYDPERGCVTLMEDDPLLEPGQEIMFFTRRDEGRGWHRIFSAGYGDVRIEDEQHRKELVRRFERAQKDQTDPLR